MSRDYISSEIDKIQNDSNFDDSLSKAMTCAWILGNFKGINLKVMDMNEQSSVASYYVLATSSNITQAASMADEIIHQIRRCGGEILSKEGSTQSDWMLLDCGDVIVHIFQETARDTYGLEDLWSNAKSVKIPDSYYFSSEQNYPSASTLDDKGRDFF